MKVAFALVAIDSQLKITYNSTLTTHPAISTHWRKFKRWIRETVLHGDSDRQRLSKEFTTARQRLTEDPNQFYLRLLNMGIQAGRTVNIEEYRTRLVMPLQIRLDEQERSYATVQDIAAHAGRLWQHLTPAKIRREIRDFKEDTNPANHPQEQLRDYRQARDRQPQSDQHSRQSRHPRDRQNDRTTRLPTKEHRRRTEDNLCYRCGQSGHRAKDCTNEPTASKADTTRSSQTRARDRGPRARAQPARARARDSADDETDPDDLTSDASEPERPHKRQKH